MSRECSPCDNLRLSIAGFCEFGQVANRVEGSREERGGGKGKREKRNKFSKRVSGMSRGRIDIHLDDPLDSLVIRVCYRVYI